MSSKNELDISVLKKFNRPGPRYTSYPTAPVFTPDFTAEDYRREIVATNREPNGGPLSLYFHFPFCKKLCYFCGCNMRVTSDRGMIKEYNGYLKQEIDLIRPMISNDRKVSQLHWGGGTPSYLEPEQIVEVGGYVKNLFDYDEDIEASVEIDPRGLRREHMEAFREVGFNR
ncbi:MAG TPA: radical SAM protein, partial [Pyrinomonadaceae bacterium]|nr:radical SAM protein [Pyrinomonadaceae bacterium]